MTTGSSTEISRRVVTRMVERGMIDGDVEAAMASYSPDVRYHNPMLRDMPAEVSTLDVIRQSIGATREAFPDFSYAIEAVIADGDMAAVLYTWTGTHEWPLGGLPATGRPVRSTGAIVCRVADGRIVEQWDVDDRLDVMQQLGLFPPAGR